MPENQTGTLEAIGQELAKVFQPLKERVEAGQILELMAELGLAMPEDLANDPDFSSALTDIVTNIQGMATKVSELVTLLSATELDYAAITEKTVQLIELIAGMIEDITTIGTEVNGYVSDHESDFPEGSTAVLNALEDFAKNLFDYLMINYIESVSTLLAAFLEFFGIIKKEVINDPGTATLPTVTRKSLELGNILKLCTDPAGLLNELYGWGDTTLHDGGKTLLEKLCAILTGLGWPSVFTESPSPELDVMVGTVVPTSGLNPQGLALVFDQALGSSFSQTWTQSKWTLTLTITAEVTPNAEITLQPGGNIEIGDTGGVEVSGDMSLEWVAKDTVNNEPLLLFGTAGESRLEAGEIRALLSTGFDWNMGTGSATGKFTIEAEIKDGKLAIKPGDPDGFLAKILPPDGFELDFDVLMGVSSEKGVYFKGSGTLKFNFPLSISLGPISILNLSLALTLDDPLAIALGTTIKAELGPFTATVEDIGVKLLLSFPDDRNGNLGAVNLGIEFKPPTGVGLSLDAGVVKGGGYLLIDSENGRYAGAIELTFEGLFGFTAIAIINTKFPDGSEGFSMLLLINVTFGTPIALGFGFFLGGVGGLIGLHRTMDTNAIRNGVKDGSISNILFPENVIANITEIIADLEAIFPIKQDQFFLGLMARITWGVPTLLTIEAGIALEFPNPWKLALLGVIRCILPDPSAAVLKLNVAFAGIIDFEKKLLSFDASIFDSAILTITLEGDMALRISWGDNPDFLVSIGGFHPSYTPPAHLEVPSMKRMTVNILSGNPRLVLTAYFALTTNTIQFGAKLEFSFTVAGFGIYGKLGFDVLIQFSPFRFIASIYASVEVRAGSTVLFSIDLEFTLEGPAPWRAVGHASFKILFIKVKVSFDKTWGENKTNSLPSTAVLDLLLAELEKDTNWQALPAANAEELVTLNPEVSLTDAVLVRPFGSLEVNQTVVPLDLTMEKFGNYVPEDITQATVKRIRVNSEDFEDADFTDLKNSFAPSAFKNLSDADKLSSPSYSKQNSGVRLTTTDQTVFDYGINRDVKYEVILSDEEEVELGLQHYGMDFFKPFISGGDVGKSELSKSKKNAMQYADKRVTLADERFAVANVKTMANAHPDSLVFDTKAEADEYIRTAVAADSKLRGKLQLTPEFQLA
jgi:hypothetical protein